VFGRTGSPIAASSARRFSDARAATTVDQVLDVGMQQLSCETGQSTLAPAAAPPWWERDGRRGEPDEE